MEFHDNYKRLVGGILQYIYRIVDIAIEQERKIIIWGFGRGGKWIRHLINDYDGRLQVAYIIDEKYPVSYDSFPVIYRHTLLNYLNKHEYIILSSVQNSKDVISLASKYGYRLGDNFFDVRSDIGGSYIEFLEKKDQSINFSPNGKGAYKEYEMGCNEHMPFGHSCGDIVFSEIVKLDNDISFFDFGCGKGSALLMAYLHGITKLGGVELVPEIYEQLIINMERLGIDCNLIQGDATTCNIDEYNCFFFYNPFVGKIFSKTIHNIEESYRKKPRNIYLIYGNPFEHNEVMKCGLFTIIKQIRVDLYDPLLNIYKIECEKND